MLEPTLIEGVTVPSNWAVDRRGARHRRLLAHQAANGEQVKGISTELPFVHQLTLRRIQALQSERV